MANIETPSATYRQKPMIQFTLPYLILINEDLFQSLCLNKYVFVVYSLPDYYLQRMSRMQFNPLDS